MAGTCPVSGWGSVLVHELPASSQGFGTPWATPSQAEKLNAQAGHRLGLLFELHSVFTVN